MYSTREGGRTARADEGVQNCRADLLLLFPYSSHLRLSQELGIGSSALGPLRSDVLLIDYSLLTSCTISQLHHSSSLPSTSPTTEYLPSQQREGASPPPARASPPLSPSKQQDALQARHPFASPFLPRPHPAPFRLVHPKSLRRSIPSQRRRRRESSPLLLEG